MQAVQSTSKIVTTAYPPQYNGLTQRFNGTCPKKDVNERRRKSFRTQKKRTFRKRFGSDEIVDKYSGHQQEEYRDTKLEKWDWNTAQKNENSSNSGTLNHTA